MNVVDQLLGDYLRKSDAILHAAHLCNSGDSVCNYLSTCIEQIKNDTKLQVNSIYNLGGRVGPQVVVTSTSTAGSKSNQNRYGVISGEAFSTNLANVGVSKGKWMFEVVLGSSGVIQIGWSVHNPLQPFSDELGVGDTLHSYSYDGHRKLCWNVYSKEYGQHWVGGDIITSFIDLDARTISYARNGENLGVAFEDIETGPRSDDGSPGCIYIPTISMAKLEMVFINYGSMPFVHPLQGFQPLQPPPNISTASTGLQLLRNILITSEGELNKCTPFQLISNARIKHQLSKKVLDVLVWPTVQDPSVRRYFARGCLPHFMQTLIGEQFMKDSRTLTSEDRSKLKPLMDFLSLIDVHLQKEERESLFENLLNSWVVLVGQSCKDLQFLTTKRVLRLAIAFFSHPPTRRYCLKHKLFYRESASMLIALFKLPIDEALMMIAVTHEANNPPNEEEKERITLAIQEVELLHVTLLQTLLTVESDQPTTESSRVIFLRELKTNIIKFNSLSFKLHIGSHFQSFFKALLLCLDQLWRSEGTEISQRLTPVKYFFWNEPFFLKNNRVGGGHDSVSITHVKEVNDYLKQITGKFDATGLLYEVTSDWHERSLYGLTDALVHFYHLCVHKSFVKDGISKEQHFNALKQYNELRELCQGLQHSNTILEKNLSVLKEQCEKLYVTNVWSDLMNFSGRKASGLVSLLDYVVNTLTYCGRHVAFLPFVPEYYIDTLTGLTTGLMDSFHVGPYIKPTQRSSFVTATTFIGRHFLDKRIVMQDCKENIIHCMGSLVSSQPTLELMHSLDSETRVHIVRSLLSRYDGRLWGHSNWILVRFWTGDGFGFRYTVSPHLLTKITPKPAYSDKGPQLIKPLPSQVFQEDIKGFIKNNIKYAHDFLSSVISQLNWSFSEFTGMIQEINSYSKCPGRVFIDSRQLRICCTCFDLSVALLRVMEMVLTLCPDIVLTQDMTYKEQAEVLLTMICKALCLVLFRVSVGEGHCFSSIVSLEIPGMDSVHHYPIVTASVGVLLALLQRDLKNRGSKDYIPVVTNMIVSEAGFNMTTFERLCALKEDLEIGQTSENADTKSSTPSFSLRDYPGDVSTEELARLQECVSYLKEYHRLKESSPTEPERENECVICCEREATTIMMPCQHRACRLCIVQQLMSRNTCFFCKSVMQSTRDESTGEYISNLIKPDDSSSTGASGNS